MYKVLKYFIDVAAILSLAGTAAAQSNTFTATPTSLVFCGQPGQTVSTAPITVSTSTANESFYAFSVTSDSGWLSLNPISGVAETLPATGMFAGVNGGVINLPLGTYGGQIVVGDLYTRATLATISATLHVTADGCGPTAGPNSGSTGELFGTPGEFFFALPAGATTAYKDFEITNKFPLNAYGLTQISTTGGGNWLSSFDYVITLVSGYPTPLVIGVDATGLTAGSTYHGTVEFDFNTGVSLLVPVTLILGASGGNAIVYSKQSPLNMNVPAPATATTQQFQLANITSSPISITPSVTSGQSWLSVSSAPVSIDGNSSTWLTATIHSSGLTIGQYRGAITVNIAGGGANYTIPVNLNYGGANGGSVLVSSVPSLSITVPPGATAPVNQSLTLAANANLLSISASATTTTGEGWLSVNPPTALASPINFVNATVSVNPALLPPGVSKGVVVFTPDNGGSPLEIIVNVTNSSSVSFTPARLSFAYQAGAPLPQTQNITVTAGTTGTGFGAQATTSTGGNWLSVSPLSAGATPAVLTVAVNPGGLAPNTYTGQIVITDTNNVSQSIPVSLLVGNSAVLLVGDSGTTFNYQAGSLNLSTQQTVAITSSGASLPFSLSVVPVSGGNFLNATPVGGSTPQVMSLSLNQSVISQLTPNTYTANVILTSPAAANSPVTYPVTLNVTNAAQLNSSQSSLTFNYQLGQAAPSPQFVTISSTTGSQAYTISTTTQSCGDFLSATSTGGNTPAVIAVSVNVAGLPSGSCQGSISVIASGARLSIPVTLSVGNSAAVNVSPSAINLTTQVGANPAIQVLSVTSSDPAASFKVAVTTSTTPTASWLSALPSSNSTPNKINVTLNTADLAVGTYTGSIAVISTASNSPVIVPVTVVITSATTAAVAPSSLSFAQQLNGSPLVPQTLQVTGSTFGLSISATASTFNGGNWLSIAPTQQSVAVSVNTNSLPVGTYTGIVTIVATGFANSPLTVPVTLTVSAPPSLIVSPPTLTFNYQAGSALSAAQSLQVSSTGATLPYAVSTPNFLSATPTSGNSPAVVSVTLNAAVVATLPAGQYSGAIIVGNQIVNATLTVTPAIGTIANGASFQTGPVSPGELIAIFGNGLGPATGVPFTLTSQGMVPATLAGTKVTFDGIAAPLIYVGAAQIDAVVPYGIAGQKSTNIVVWSNGIPSATVSQQVVDTAPGIFAALNSDGSANSPTHPAPKGSTLQIFATGEGVVPGVTTGSITSTQPPFPKPAANVTATINGQPASTQFVEAPGNLSGILQVNVVVPQNAGTGPQTLVLTIGSASNAAQAFAVSIQ